MQIISQRWLEYCTAHYDYYKAFAAQGSNYDMDTFFLNSGQDEEGLINNISLLKWHVFVSLGTSLQNQKSAILKMFQDLMQVNPLFIKLFLKYSDLPDRFDIIKEVDYTQNLEREYQQLQQVVPTLQKQIEALSRTVQDEKFKVELAKFSGQLQNVLTKLRANDKIRDNEVQAAISGIGNMQLQGEQNGA
jgi:amino acid permease